MRRLQDQRDQDYLGLGRDQRCGRECREEKAGEFQHGSGGTPPAEVRLVNHEGTGKIRTMHHQMRMFGAKSRTMGESDALPGSVSACAAPKACRWVRKPAGADQSRVLAKARSARRSPARCSFCTEAGHPDKLKTIPRLPESKAQSIPHRAFIEFGGHVVGTPWAVQRELTAHTSCGTFSPWGSAISPRGDSRSSRSTSTLVPRRNADACA
jgi:hypothetical protein